MRSTLAAYNRRDVEAYLVPFDREARYEIARQSEEMGLYEPSFPVHDGIGGLWEELDAAWGEVRIDPRELIDLGPHVVMLGKMEGQGVQSNAPVSFALATVSTLNSDGKVIRIREYIDHAEALEAVGLSE